MWIQGQCHCGKVSFQAEVAEDAGLTLCHCTDCQALTGTAFRTTLPVDPDRLEIRGDLTVYEKRAASGRVRHLLFCPTCGSQMFSHGDGPADPWGVRWGCIDDRGGLPLRRQIWRRSAPVWVCAFGDVPASAEE